MDLMAVDRDSPTPLTLQLHQQVSWLIASRVVTAGETLPPIRAVADHIGINLHTVRAAYQRLERDGLVKMERRRGTTVLPTDAWRLSGREAGSPTSTIGIIIPTHGSLFYAPFLSGVEGGTPRSTLAFVSDAGENPERGVRIFDQLVAKRVDGILVAGPMLPLDMVAGHIDRYPPLVCADFPTAPGPRVELDLDAAGRLATEHLIEHGHHRIGLITPPVALANVAPRVDAYRRTLFESGLPGGDELIAEVGDWSSDAGARGMSALLELTEPPTAVVSVSDSLTVGVVRAARANGVTVPDDLALVSIDNSPVAQMVDPALTSISLSAYDLGRRAVEMLGKLMADMPLEDECVVIPTELLLGDSCGSHR